MRFSLTVTFFQVGEDGHGRRVRLELGQRRRRPILRREEGKYYEIPRTQFKQDAIKRFTDEVVMKM
jgi:hypothetical protein